MNAPAVSRYKRGSVLAMVVGVAAVLFVLTAVAYTYFQMNMRSSMFKMNRVRASMAAEAGASLALHHLSTLESIPGDGAPFVIRMEGDSAGWIGIPYCGSVNIVVDPFNTAGGLYGNGAVEIRSRGLSGDVTIDVELRATPAYPSSYALLTDNGIPEGFFVDGRIVEGSVHSNGTIHFSSYSPDSTDDPFVTMISTAQEGFSFTGAGTSDQPHPPGSNVWVRPYAMHRQGSPYWRVSAPDIDFTRMAAHFRGIVTGSVQSSAVRITAERILIEGERLVYRENQSAMESSVDLEQVNLVIARNGFSPVMIKSVRIPEHPLTIITVNDMEIGGGIDGGAAGSGGPLGLVALGNIVIPADPDETGDSDWRGRWQIETDGSFLIRACLAAPSGSFYARVPRLPEELTRVTVSGSLVERTMGRMSSVNSGYELGTCWEQGLGALHPPFFPMLGRWNVYSWIIDPPEDEFAGREIEDDII